MMSRHMEFVRRLKSRIAANQGAPAGSISVARAAKDIGCPETTLRSTLEGRYPRSEVYWRQLRTYCGGSLDWLICGLGEPPDYDLEGQKIERILIAERDYHKLELIRMALKGRLVEVAHTPTEAAKLNLENNYDLILSSSNMNWSLDELTTIKRHRLRPRLILLDDNGDSKLNPFSKLADQTIEGPLEASQISKMVAKQLEILKEESRV